MTSSPTLRERRWGTPPSLDPAFVAMAAVRIVGASNEQEKQQIAAEVVEVAYRDGVLRSWAEVHLTAERRAIDRHAPTLTLNDAEQISAEAMMYRLVGATPKMVSSMKNWSGKLFLVCRDRIASNIEREYNEVAGASTLLRRQAVARTAYNRISEHGRFEVSDEEVIAEANREAASRKIGLVKKAHLAPSSLTASEWVTDDSGTEVSVFDLMQSHEPTPEAVAVERDGIDRAVRLLVEVVGEGDPDVARFALAWAQAVAHGERSPHLVASRETGLPTRVRGAFQQRLAEHRSKLSSLIAEGR